VGGSRIALANQFVLSGSPHSQFTYKVALMLRLSGAPFQFRYISFRTGMHRTPEFLALSRYGQVPVLQHGDLVLVQSGAILEYLSEQLGKFSATDVIQRQRVREWLYWDADRLASPIYRSYGYELGRQGLLPIIGEPAVVAHFREVTEAALAVIDNALVGRNWLVGETVTIADIGCYGDVAFADRSGFELSRWPNVQAWITRFSDLPGWQAALDLLPMADAEIGSG
jgi:glutathione S-transferase